MFLNHENIENSVHYSEQPTNNKTEHHYNTKTLLTLQHSIS